MRWFCFGILLAAGVLHARPGDIDEDFVEAPALHIDNIRLLLNGVGLYRVFLFDVYEVELYLKTKTRDVAEILASSDVKYARMRMRRSLTSLQIRNGFETSFRENCGEFCAAVDADLKALMGQVPDMSKGKSFEFFLYPDRTVIEVEGVGRTETQGPEFGRVLLRTWLGNSPPSERFKKGLLGDQALLPSENPLVFPF